jgi:hypothetical protein
MFARLCNRTLLGLFQQNRCPVTRQRYDAHNHTNNHKHAHPHQHTSTYIRMTSYLRCSSRSRTLITKANFRHLMYTLGFRWTCETIFRRSL